MRDAILSVVIVVFLAVAVYAVAWQIARNIQR